MSTTDTNESGSRATAPVELDPTTAREILRQQFNTDPTLDYRVAAAQLAARELRLRAAKLDEDDPLANALLVTAESLELRPVADMPVKDQDRVDVEKTRLGLDDVGGYPVGRSAGQVRVSAERVQGILHGLNSFPDREYDNLTEAIDWAKSQPDVAAAYGPLLGEANLQLVDGTVIEWQSDRKCWDVAVSDECDTSEVSR